MNDEVLRFVLDGLEDYLGLVRELGIRTVEIDRMLLEPAPRRETAERKDPSPMGAVKPPKSSPRGLDKARVAETQGPVGTKALLDFVFIADRPLSPKATEMMAKIIPAMGKTPETAPIVVTPPIPNARFFVFLGRTALAKYMPGLRGEENHWLKSPKGKDVLFVKSPEEIVRFSTVTPALKKVKQDMWLALKTVMQRVRIKD